MNESRPGIFTALSATVGGVGITQGWSPLIVIGLFVLAGLVLLATFANRLPLLHRLPVVGAPRLQATFSLDGRSEMTLRMPPDEARTALLQVGIRNPDRLNITDATVNLLMTEGIRRWKSDHSGRPDPRGVWMRPTTEQIGEDDPDRWKDYWADATIFPGRNSVVWWFQVRFKRPGMYRFRLKVSSSSLYREFRKHATLRVIELQGAPTIVERVDALIDEGEGMLASHPDGITEDPLAAGLGPWEIKAVMTLPKEYDEMFQDAEGDAPRRPTGREYYIDEIRPKLAALYEIRRRLSGG